jgi:sugar-specific transcriptional regulator TrmB
MNISTFIDLGFTQNEARLYSYLVEAGRLSAYALAKKLSLPRSTVYSVLGVLEHKGLVRKEPVKGTWWYRVDNPEDLLEIFEKEESVLLRKKQLATILVKELKQVFKTKSNAIPRLEYYEGKANIEKFLFNYLPVWRDSMLNTDKSTWGYQDDSFVKEYQPWLKEAWKVIHIEAKIAGRIISNNNQIEKNLKNKIKGREVKTLGDKFNFTSSIWVMGEYVILILTREDPHIAFQIKSTTLSRNLKLIFEYLYNQVAVKV